ncbi:hypothetical protein ACQKQC_19055 [Vibrio fortis]|uniref:hypothetical protein n=1 Tax=Vibrio fortis TaxID=212667 RepID=UPI003378C9F9|nr:conserved hypothetical protein [Vibrio chagasii]
MNNSKNNTATREETIQALASEISHTKAQEWLRSSDLSIEEMNTLVAKYRKHIGVIFRAIPTSASKGFTPRELLDFKAEVALSCVRVSEELASLNFSLELNDEELVIVWDRIKHSFKNEFYPEGIDTNANLLIVRIKGNKVDSRLAQIIAKKKNVSAMDEEKIRELVKPHIEALPINEEMKKVFCLG